MPLMFFDVMIYQNLLLYYNYILAIFVDIALSQAKNITTPGAFLAPARCPFRTVFACLSRVLGMTSPTRTATTTTVMVTTRMTTATTLRIYD